MATANGRSKQLRLLPASRATPKTLIGRAMSTSHRRTSVRPLPTTITTRLMRQSITLTLQQMSARPLPITITTHLTRLNRIRTRLPISRLQFRYHSAAPARLPPPTLFPISERKPQAITPPHLIHTTLQRLSRAASCPKTIRLSSTASRQARKSILLPASRAMPNRLTAPVMSTSLPPISVRKLQAIIRRQLILTPRLH